MIYPLALILLFIFGVLLGSPDAPFPQGDEIMHIRSVRESLELGSIVIPSLSGLPNPYKPPLLFWMGMSMDSIFGISYFSERLVSTLFGIGTLILLFQLSFRISKSKSEAFLTTILFGFSFLSLKFFGLLMMEGPMVFFLLFYFYTFYLYKVTNKNQYLILGSLVSGIGYLLKGPILHVYILLFLVSYFYVKVIRFRKGKISFQWKQIWKEKVILLTYSLTFILPIAWILFLYFQVPSGKDLLRFFFITENVGKFYSTNQSGLRIWFGWLLYTIPFTIPFLQLIWNSLRKQKQNKNQIYIMVFLVFFLLVTVLHLLPNRKDPYYVTPFISFLFLLPALQNVTWRSILITKTNLYAILLVYILLLMASIILRLHFLFLFTILAILLLVGALYFSQNKERQWHIIVYTQVLILPMIVFFLLKPMADPEIGEVTKQAEQETICVVAENPWTAMDVQNKLKRAQVQFALPLTINENCSKSNYLISFVPAEIPSEFQKISSWYQWKQHLQLNSKSLVRSILRMEKQKFQTEIILWKRGESI
ncbi:ArnT family glycosyltransferase [Leptospira sp. WS39.C2]